MKSTDILLARIDTRLKRSELILEFTFVFFVYLTTQVILVTILVVTNSINFASITATLIISAGIGLLVGGMLITGLNNYAPIK